jgi:hypothetical protein
MQGQTSCHAVDVTHNLMSVCQYEYELPLITDLKNYANNAVFIFCTTHQYQFILMLNN